MTTNYQTLLHRALIWICMFYIFWPSGISATSNYTPTIVYIIPWGGDFGNNYGGLSTRWGLPLTDSDNYQNCPAPGPWAISQSQSLVICDSTGNRINKYNSLGNFIGYFNMSQIMGQVSSVAILNSGEVLLVSNGLGLNAPPEQLDHECRLYLLNPNMGLIEQTLMPQQGDGWRVYPSNSDFFYLRCNISSDALVDYNRRNVTHEEISLYQYDINGVLSLPQLIWSGYSDDPGYDNYYYISPEGLLSGRIFDAYGSTYAMKYGGELTKYDLQGVVDYSINVQDDPNWIETYQFLSSYQIMPSGDFYNLHAADTGAVLTKYTLVTNNPPPRLLLPHNSHALYRTITCQYLLRRDRLA
jgi:hypothetical protein